MTSMTSMTSMTVAVRDTRWTDLAELARLETELFGADAWSEASWWSELAGRPRRAYVTAEHDGQIVGYAGLDRGGSVADVMTIAVTPAARGTGLGRRLLSRLLELADGAEAVMLEVRADNEAARSLYASAGFELVSTRRRYYGDVDALVLRALLPQEATPGAPADADHDVPHAAGIPARDPAASTAPTASTASTAPTAQEGTS